MTGDVILAGFDEAVLMELCHLMHTSRDVTVMQLAVKDPANKFVVAYNLIREGIYPSCVPRTKYYRTPDLIPSYPEFKCLRTPN